MVTTTMSPRVARFLPSYSGSEPEPSVKPPPWIQKKTGRFALSAAGVYTLRYRQSSSRGPLAAVPGIGLVPWIAELANAFAGRTPAQAWAGGVAAKGRPRNA